MSTVRLTRSRHPFEGQPLPVLGRMRRHGEVELLVVLPDGSKRLIPAAWTDLERPPGVTDAGDGLATLGSVPDLLGLSVLVSDLSARSVDDGEQAARKSPCKEDDRAACSTQSAAGPGSGTTPGHHRPASRPAGRRGGHAAGRPDRQGSRHDGRGG